ncbi:unnamed protein product [Cuscuta epithymum]|uniref:LOB domain-containing protein n=1 Tax=Cuscuta epithymum TaxID=186058 RepID=A0AAV0E0T3_9ASTE|nr:unnamed protein product [Cuscuta epithymum]
MEKTSTKKIISGGRCAACKQLRRRCPSNCIFLPYFPPNDPQRFAFVHKIFGTSNVEMMLQQVEEHERADVAESLYYEAHCRIKDPVYGCAGIITILCDQISNLECQLARVQAQMQILKAQQLGPCLEDPQPQFSQHFPLNNFRLYGQARKALVIKGTLIKTLLSPNFV